MLFKQEDQGHVSIYRDEDNPVREQIIPLVVGKTYPVFDDGKITYGRLMYYTIDEEIDLDANPDALTPDEFDHLSQEINTCYWLYNKEQHIIYRAHETNKDGSEIEDTEETHYDHSCLFLRTYDHEWFGACNWLFNGLVDVDGSLESYLII